MSTCYLSLSLFLYTVVQKGKSMFALYFNDTTVGTRKMKTMSQSTMMTQGPFQRPLEVDAITQGFRGAGHLTKLSSVLKADSPK